MSKRKISNTNIIMILTKKYKYELIVASIIVIFVMIYASYIASYTQLPSPIYGGDFYRDRGFVQNIVAGNPFWSDAFYVNEIQYYPYFLFVVQATIVLITGLSVDTVFLLFPLVTLILGGIFWYLLGKTIVNDKLGGIILLLSSYALLYRNDPKSGTFALFFLVPAFLYSWLMLEKNNRIKWKVIAGMFLGLMALTYGGTFLAVFFMFVFTICSLFIFELIKKKNSIQKLLLEYLHKYWISLTVTVGLASLYFLPLIIKYRWHQVNNVSQWGDIGLQFLGPSWVLDILKSLFFNTSSILYFVVSIFALAGLTSTIVFIKRIEFKILFFAIISNIIAIQHHLLTKPLFNIWFLPEKLYLITLFLPILFTVGFFILIKSVRFKYSRQLFSVLVIFFLIFIWHTNYDDYTNSQWEIAGHSDSSYTQSLYGLGNYIQENVAKDEAILSNDESGFMLSVVSGRKVMLTRRTHASYFVDIDERIADASIILYGNNITVSKNLLQKYNVKYFYVDQQLLQNPLRTNTNHASYLSQYNVTYQKIIDRYDIAVPFDRANTFPLLIIPPQKISDEFIDLWEPVYTVVINNQPIGQLLKLKE